MVKMLLVDVDRYDWDVLKQSGTKNIHEDLWALPIFLICFLTQNVLIPPDQNVSIRLD